MINVKVEVNAPKVVMGMIQDVTSLAKLLREITCATSINNNKNHIYDVQALTRNCSDQTSVGDRIGHTHTRKLNLSQVLLERGDKSIRKNVKNLNGCNFFVEILLMQCVFKSRSNLPIKKNSVRF